MNQQYRWITVSEAARVANISTDLIYAAIKSGALQSIRIGAGLRIRTTEEWVHAYLAASSTGGPAPASNREMQKSA